MANLGSDNTPIEGESFGLPSGYSFDEENGDLVIRDTDGTVVMRRADGAAWQLEGSDISGVGAFDSESVNTEESDTTIFNGRYFYTDVQTFANNHDSDGNVLIMNDGFNATETFSRRVKIRNDSFIAGGSAFESDANLTFERNSVLEHIRASSGASFTFDRASKVIDSDLGSATEITFQADESHFRGNVGGDVTFESGTENGVAVGNSATSITDNGNNEVLGNT